MIWPGTRLTPCLEHGLKKKERKYKNRPEWSDLANRRFDSAGERRRGEELMALQKAGAIRNLRFQVRYPLVVNGVRVCSYVADFVYENVGFKAIIFRTGEMAPPVVEDYKGYESAEWKLKQKLFRAVMGYDITVVRKGKK